MAAPDGGRLQGAERKHDRPVLVSSSTDFADAPVTQFRCLRSAGGRCRFRLRRGGCGGRRLAVAGGDSALGVGGGAAAEAGRAPGLDGGGGAQAHWCRRHLGVWVRRRAPWIGIASPPRINLTYSSMAYGRATGQATATEAHSLPCGGAYERRMKRSSTNIQDSHRNKSNIDHQYK